MTRRMVLLVVLVIAMTRLLSGFSTVPLSGHLTLEGAAQEVPLDLASIAPVPADLGDGYGIARGAYQTEAEIAGSVFGNAGAPTALDQALADAGAQQTYWRRSVLRSEDDPDLYARLFDSLLIEFGSEAEAEAGFTAYHDLLSDYDELRAAPAVGDEALAFRGAFTDPTQGSYKEVRVLTRIGRVVIDLSLWDFTGDAPSTSEVVATAGMMEERLADADPSGSSGRPVLALRVPRLTGEDVSTPSDYYIRQSGEELRTDGVSTSQLQSDTQFFDDVGITDRYFYFASTVPAEDADDPYVSALVELYRFADEDRAGAYLETVAENWVDTRSEPYHDAELVDGAAEFADGSAFATYEYDYAWGTVTGYHVWLRVGDHVASVEMDGVPTLSLADMETMAEVQLACLEDGGCPGSLTPADVRQGNAAVSPADTPEIDQDESVDLASDTSSGPMVRDTPVSIADETPDFEDLLTAPTDESAEPSAVTESYISPSFGYALNYDPTQWTVDESPSTDADGVDTIKLSAGFSTLYLSGIPSSVDAQTCVQILTDAQTSEANVVGFEPLLDDVGLPDAGGDVTDAYATTRITRVMEDGANVDQAFYARCVALPSVGAVLTIQQFAAELIYDVASEQREQLLEGLILP